MKSVLRSSINVSAALAMAGFTGLMAAAPAKVQAFATASGAMLGLSGAATADKNIVQTAVDAGSFGTLAKALTAAELIETLSGPGPFTVLAPTDDAFGNVDGHALRDLLKSENKKSLQGVLTYHVIAGRVSSAELLSGSTFRTVNGQLVKIALKDGRLRANDSSIVKADIEASNGVIHVIDKVLMPSTKNLAETASGAKSFKTLIAAAKAAGLVPALTGDAPLTIFAPTDEAFAKLPAGLVEKLLKPENKNALAAILKYHVVAGRVYGADAIKAGTAATLQGGSVKITLADGRLKVNDSGISKTDLDTSNGVIHVIDKVLVPEGVLEQVAQMSVPKDAAGLVTMAIDRGVPLFNAGQHGACASVYEVCVASLAMMPESVVPAKVRGQLRDGLTKAAAAGSDTDRAWALRESLDAAMAALATTAAADDDENAMTDAFREAARKMKAAASGNGR